jgi:hypothetical protein
VFAPGQRPLQRFECLTEPHPVVTRPLTAPVEPIKQEPFQLLVKSPATRSIIRDGIVLQVASQSGLHAPDGFGSAITVSVLSEPIGDLPQLGAKLLGRCPPFQRAGKWGEVRPDLFILYSDSIGRHPGESLTEAPRHGGWRECGMMNAERGVDQLWIGRGVASWKGRMLSPD